jgi:hypothetical protein
MMRLVLKQSTGWFAAGWAFGDAMELLSDRAFKLFVWVCLNADRQTGRLPVSALERSVCNVEAALAELVERGVCTRGNGEIEVADRYWPYEKQRPPGAGPQEFVAGVRKLLAAPACVRCRFTPADEKLARGLHARGVTLPQVERAIWLGCMRKYATLLNHAAAPSMPIASLQYFAAVIDEVVSQPSTPESYWAYVHRQFRMLEQRWLASREERTAEAR